MKLIGIQSDGDHSIGVVEDGAVRPLATVDEFYADVDGWLDKAKAGTAGFLALSDLQQVPFVPATAKVLCVGLNYLSHASEASMALPDYPTVFGRWASTLVVDGATIPVPDHEDGLDWEVELAVVVGRRLTDASESEAAAAILGYSGFNDVSARKRQFETAQWTLGKNADFSAPLGPVLVTADEWEGTPDLALETLVNGEVMQSSRTSSMIFSPAAILAYVSKTTTLEPGDVIATGTPEGVGFVRSPVRLLVEGDVLESRIESIGAMRNPIAGSAQRNPQQRQ
ncbi:fumarylacetoacetate hydrolase family protein [Nocardioides mesophilus]|uniref:Fumarylacetoacetate hydrolase family protein n=1 Tax=Nocardioides mesophilus TaxID=433659 RepID=A0A7G9RFL9_9ACTN|nr:fumarylacetoacetate hydrolase family protein [Nocardioides mesophilus]QNN54394.1 fumarylacetoacetate hydrolase family protein [Nocardioides mesophilus]